MRQRDGHQVVLLNAHSTGGLTACLYAAARPHGHEIDALFLNSPFLGTRSLPVRWTPFMRVIERLGRHLPDLAYVGKGSSHYVRSLHRGAELDGQGEWDFDTRWKRKGGLPPSLGWLAAVSRGHRQILDGIQIDVPILVMCSRRRGGGRSWNPSYRDSDVVLDPSVIMARAYRLGTQVTGIQLEGALHDVMLSNAKVRREAYDALFAWLARFDDGRTRP